MATATNTSGNLHSETLLLFDSGSQRTYISTELTEKLKLPAVRQKTILIKTFGQSAFSAQTIAEKSYLSDAHKKMLEIHIYYRVINLVRTQKVQKK